MVSRKFRRPLDSGGDSPLMIGVRLVLMSFLCLLLMMMSVGVGKIAVPFFGETAQAKKWFSSKKFWDKADRCAQERPI